MIFYFNPRPHAGATAKIDRDETALLISIHAPMRGRPYVENLKKALAEISIHAPMRGRRPLILKEC